MLLQIFIGIVVFLAIFLGVIYYQIFIHGKERKRILFDEEYEKKRAENYPPPFPNGWYSLCSSDMVSIGKVIEVEALGQKFAVFRGEDGKVGVLDVYCPHLNANLTQGKVVGNNLECPFHAWQFNKNGKCTHIPYSDKQIPANAATRSWTSNENWGLILLWYHALNEAPSWSTDGYLPEINSYKFHSKTSDILRIHLQDFAENGADYAHFEFVHGLMTIPFANWFVEVKHRLEIVFCEGEEKHMAYFTDYADLVWKKNKQLIPHAGGKAVVTYFGPGFLVFKFDTKIGKMLLIKTFTPLGPLKLRMDDYVYAPKGTFPIAIKYLLGEAGAQFKDDIAIWEKKSFTNRPLLVKGDGPIMKMRAWYSQFYSQSNAMTEIVKEEVDNISMN
jgi:cholesterol 7-dehydrogenase